MCYVYAAFVFIFASEALPTAAGPRRYKRSREGGEDACLHQALLNVVVVVHDVYVVYTHMYIHIHICLDLCIYLRIRISLIAITHTITKHVILPRQTLLRSIHVHLEDAHFQCVHLPRLRAKANNLLDMCLCMCACFPQPVRVFSAR